MPENIAGTVLIFARAKMGPSPSETGKLFFGREIPVANLWHNRVVAGARLPADRQFTRIVPEARYDRVRD